MEIYFILPYTSSINFVNRTFSLRFIVLNGNVVFPFLRLRELISKYSAGTTMPRDDDLEMHLQLIIVAAWGISDKSWTKFLATIKEDAQPLVS